MAAIFTYSQNHRMKAWQKWASMYGAQTDCVLLTVSKTVVDFKTSVGSRVGRDTRIGAKILSAIFVSLSRRMRFSAGRLVDHLKPK